MSRLRSSRRRLASAAAAPARAVGPAAQTPRKTRAAGVSIVSNSVLIALKLAAGAITGSIAIITEAIHSSIDLIASVVAFYSVRKAGEPADESHPYGHEKVENLAAAIEGMLILVGAGIIVYESVRRLFEGAEVESLGVGIAVIGFSAVANVGVSAYLQTQARRTESPALEGDAAHLRTDAATSFGVLLALVLVEVTGVEQFDPATALIVAVAIVFAGVAPGDRPPRRPGGGRLPQAARAPGGQPPLRRPARAVQEGHQPRTRARGVARAPGRDPPQRARRRRAHPPRARGSRRPRAQVRFTAAAAPTASRIPE
jgi:Co/Zn/Cd efflux system component